VPLPLNRMAPAGRPCGLRNGFTLLELVVVVGILLILAVLIFPNGEAIVKQADRVVCTAKLRNLWTTFSTHLEDGRGWPQLPSSVSIGTTAEQEWWLSSTSNSMGLSSKDWRCPSLNRSLRRATNSQTQPYLISYLPSLFDDKPATPRRWLRMPWFTEVAGSHGGVGLSVRADGSVSPSTDR